MAFYIQQLFSLLFSLAGLFVLATVTVLLVLGLTTTWMRWVLVAAAVYATTLATLMARAGETPVILAFPIQQLAAFGRPFTILILACLFLVSLAAFRGWRTRLFSSPMILLFLMQMVMSTEIALFYSPSKGLAAMVVFILFFLSTGLGISRWLQSWYNLERLLIAMVGAHAMFLLANIYQLLIHPGVIVAGSRFSSTAGNPQMAAVVLSILMFPTIYLLVRKSRLLHWRIILGTLIGFTIVLLLWTGSRTGALMTLVGLGVFFRTRLSRMAVLLGFSAVFILIAFVILKPDTGGFEHLTSTGNSRTEAWSMMWRDFVSSPIVGQTDPEKMLGYSENSYLMSAARYGLIGLIPLLIFIFALLADIVRLNSIKPYLGDESLLVDMVSGAIASILIASIFEGILVGILTVVIPMLYILMAISNFLQDAVKFSTTQQSQLQWHAAHSSLQPD